jgi:hypothetical protein
MKWSAVPEKPLKTACGCVSGVLLDVVVLRSDKAAPTPSRRVRIFFMVSPLDGLENNKKRPAKGAVFGGLQQAITVSYRYLRFGEIFSSCGCVSARAKVLRQKQPHTHRLVEKAAKGSNIRAHWREKFCCGEAGALEIFPNLRQIFISMTGLFDFDTSL